MAGKVGQSAPWKKLEKFFAQVDAGAPVAAAAAGNKLNRSAAFRWLKLRNAGKLVPPSETNGHPGPEGDREARIAQAMDIAESEGVPAAAKKTGINAILIRARMEKAGRQWHLLRRSRRAALHEKHKSLSRIIANGPRLAPAAPDRNAVSRAHAMITAALEPLSENDRRRILRSVSIFYEQETKP